MKFHQVDKTTGRVDGIQNIYDLRRFLEEKGKFSANYGLYNLHVPIAGDIEFSTNWWPNAVDIKIKHKPWLISERRIFEVLQEELAKIKI